MLALLARIDRHDARRRGRPVNPTFGALRQRVRFRLAEHRSEDALPAFLTAREARVLIDFATARSVVGHGPHGSWQDLRNRTAVAIQLGAGVTPGEARLLTLDQVRVAGGERKGEPWKLALPGNGNFPARETPLARWAGRQLGQWLAVRGEAGILGPQVFPSTRSGRVWSKVAFVDACRNVMQAAGVAHPSGGSFKLRHTFAIRQLTRHPPEDVARWLGIQDVEQMTRYTRVLQGPVEVV
jgi:integrase